MRYTATRAIHHNGKMYLQGDDLPLEPRFAEILLQCGAIVVSTTPVAPIAAPVSKKKKAAETPTEVPAETPAENAPCTAPDLT